MFGGLEITEIFLRVFPVVRFRLLSNRNLCLLLNQDTQKLDVSSCVTGSGMWPHLWLGRAVILLKGFLHLCGCSGSRRGEASLTVGLFLCTSTSTPKMCSSHPHINGISQRVMEGFELEEAFKVHLVQVPCSGLGHLSLICVAQNSIQPDFEHLQ